MPNNKLADPLHTIAELRRELAQCKAERDEALEQQTATAEVLQVINASPGAMREAAQDLLRTWRRHGHDIGFGVGISQGYATLGQIGFAERMDYTAIGTVTNLAARLCAEAKDGQILVSRRVAIAVEDTAALEEIGDLSLKGLSQAVAVYSVRT
jgi:class 3 adenylate cyclase